MQLATQFGEFSGVHGDFRGVLRFGDAEGFGVKRNEVEFELRLAVELVALALDFDGGGFVAFTAERDLVVVVDELHDFAEISDG